MEETIIDDSNAEVEVLFHQEPEFLNMPRSETPPPMSSSPSDLQTIPTGSPVQSRNAKTMVLNKKFAEDFANEPVPDMEIRLMSPEKVGEGLMGSHVEYKLVVKTSLPQYKTQDFSCVRRFSQFLWLRTQLLDHHKGYMIPPLPEKQIINRFNAEFVEFRRRELERFLFRLVSHPVLIKSPWLQMFLETENLVQKEVPKPVEEKKQTGFFSSLVGNSFSGGFTSQNEPDQWFDAKKNYIIALENQLNALAKSANMLVKKQKELSQVYVDFGLSSSLLASTESDHSAWVSNSFGKLAEMSAQVSNLHESLVDNETVYFEDSIRDYVRIIGAAKEMLAVRNEKLVAYQNISKQLEDKKQKLAKTHGNTKLHKEIDDFEPKVDEAKAEFNAISEICKSELLRFESTKALEIKKILVKFTQTNINFGLQVMDQWKQFLSNELSLSINDPSLKTSSS